MHICLRTCSYRRVQIKRLQCVNAPTTLFTQYYLSHQPAGFCYKMLLARTVMTQFKSMIDFLYLWWGSWYFLHSCFFVSICVSPSLMTAAATQVKSVYCLKTQLCVFKLNFAKYRFTPTVKSMLCEKFKTEILTMAVVKIPFEHACLWYGSSK